ncbi:recombinase family protein [Lysinibacillus macroides]|uniref:Recombinase n=1 Tax=Lysinibacillus macroides TaxID=33935 RepID=A0A0M9DLG9_9BACI|nr:recombinase family protein [Lysinibacillus macroides]KOY82830.1 recombinase [Lysinibacillus macroides]QPR66121.1 recombinase family protein [Lysinibacillus macroides]
MARIRKNTKVQKPRQKIWKIAIYIRLSKDDGHDESLSVTNQRKIIQEYLDHTFIGEYVLVDYYIDDGQSGTTDYERIDFQRMIRDIETGKVDCIICKTLARAFRNYSDQGYFLERIFPLYNVRFISIGDPAIDTYINPEVVQGLEVPMAGLLNDRYAARISNDIRRTFDTKRRNGEFIGAFAPYGYKKNPENKNHLIIDEKAAQVVRNIYHWFVYDGMSKSGIVKHLNELGVPTPSQYKQQRGFNHRTPNDAKNDGMWSIGTIGRILINKMYIGTMVQGQQRVISYKIHDKITPPKDEWFVVENTHDPIIEMALFEKAQSLQKRDTRTAPSEKKVHLFSGFLRCPDCGMGMTRKSYRRQTKSGLKEYAYYVCSTYAIKHKEKCTRHSMSTESITETVLRAIQAQIALIDDMATIIKAINKQPIIRTKSKQLEQLYKVKQQELEKITAVTDNLYIDWKCGDITKVEYLRMKAKFEQKADEVTQVMANLETEMSTIQKGIGVNHPYLQIFLKYQNIQTLDRGLLVELIDTIYIHENNEITIQFNFADQHQYMLEFIQQNKKQFMTMKNQVM